MVSCCDRRVLRDLPGLTVLQMFSWGLNIINILGTKRRVRSESVISDNAHSLSQFAWTSYRRPNPSSQNVFLQTPLRLRDTVFAWDGLREILSVSFSVKYLQFLKQATGLTSSRANKHPVPIPDLPCRVLQAHHQRMRCLRRRL